MKLRTPLHRLRKSKIIGWSRLLIVAASWALLLAATRPVSVLSQRNLSDSREELILQIQQLIKDQKTDEARRELAQAARRFPTDGGFDNLLGIVEAQQGNYEAAERSFERAITRTPKFTGAYLNLGRLYQERAAADAGAIVKALDAYRRVLQYDPAHAESNFQSAALLMRRGDYQASLNHLARLPPELKNSAQTLSVICADLVGLGINDRAAEAAAGIVAHPDFNEQDARLILPTLAAKGRDDLIILLLEHLQKRQKLSPATARFLSSAYEKSDRLAEARAALENSLTNDKPSVGLLIDLARIAHRQKNYKDALGYLAHARDVEPGDARLHYYFGLVCVNLDLIAESHNAFAQAVKLEPENAAYNYALGTVAAFRRDPAESIPYLEKFARLRPQDPRAQMALGAALFRTKDYERAIGALTLALRYPENAATAHYYLGSIARQQKRLDDAVRELGEALRAKADYPDALAELGQCELSRNDFAAAERHLRRALEINPDHFTANFALLTLYSRTGDRRQAEQSARFAEIQKLREEKSQEVLRMVEFQPFGEPRD